jgi:hypothetical protein
VLPNYTTTVAQGKLPHWQNELKSIFQKFNSFSTFWND